MIFSIDDKEEEKVQEECKTTNRSNYCREGHKTKNTEGYNL